MPGYTLTLSINDSGLRSLIICELHTGTVKFHNNYINEFLKEVNNLLKEEKGE